VRDPLANGVLFVALDLMVGAPAWSVAEAIAGKPRGVVPAGDPRGAPAWRVAHLSDLHLMGEPYGFRLGSGRDGPRGNGAVARALDRVAAEDRARRLGWVLVTGDVTDAGRNAEWIAFAEALSAHPGLRDRLLILPGNHDVNIVDRANPERLELPGSPGGALRRIRFLAACAAL
jgi:calcineurin-like phosphoesterase family protein